MKRESPVKPETLGLKPFKLWQEDSSTDLRIEIIPLIDVIFCVLTFFILAAVNLSRQQAINLTLPTAESATAQMPDMVIVSLTDFGQIYVEKQLIESQAQFSQIVTDYLGRNPNGVVVLNASESRSYQEVIQVLDWLKSIGGERVALGTTGGLPEGQNLDFFFDGQNPTLNPGMPGLPQVPGVNPNNDFQFEPLDSGTPLPPPDANGFELDLLPPPTNLGTPPSPDQIQQQNQGQ
ncbi:biopolymer transport ExbD like protein [[Synechococcus] sp. NIES-970]|uniref:ExbD/TolR family protein n=1 Tax=Picosynechococcus sp. NKBG15041c TaxID=1407650 RepID=UPI0003FAEADF|nr:biopolymer transporter ExbD [Picosynechococcus sp. NKBG15041c]BAW95229.1 biopolymer transport ExbD like protein [[Synechococcus] sp. NIES-970]